MKKKRSQTKYKKKPIGSINGGVRHNIKKPKVRTSKILSKSSLKLIKTYKKDTKIQSEFEGYFNDLEELKKSKENKLIQHINTSINEEKSTTLNGNSVSSEDESDYSTYESSESVNSDKKIDEILSILDNTIEQDKENKNLEKDLLSPTSEMCNMASVMKINSPKKTKNLNLIFQEMPDNKEKLYPIFNMNNLTTKRKLQEDNKNEPIRKSKRIKIASDQLLLDAGQKRFGLTQCVECNYVYHAGDPNDESFHEKYHNSSHILKFPGWKNEHIVKKISNVERIIEILPGDSKVWIEKAKSVVEVINRDMGYFDITFDISSAKVFFYIKNKTIIGCLVAENKTKGYKIISTENEIDVCSSEEYNILCGVYRIWVAPSNRKQGIATKLMNTLKTNFIDGKLLNDCDIGFSSPSNDGKLFATKYFKTSNFFTYFD